MDEGTPTLLEAKTSVILFLFKKRQAKTHAQRCVCMSVCVCLCMRVCVHMSFWVDLEGGGVCENTTKCLYLYIKSCYNFKTQQAPPLYDPVL